MIPIQLANILLQTSTLPNAEAQLVPLLVLALMLDALIVAIWYYIGVALNNSAVKGSAKGEFYQFIGTVIMVGIIIGSLAFLSTVYYSTLGLTKLMSPSTISTLCQNIQSSSQFNLIGGTNSVLQGATTGTSAFPGICSLVNQNSNPSVTQELDYPLAATSVVIANLTNQTVTNYNASFTFDAWLGFLSQLKPTLGLCFDKPPLAEACIVPNPYDAPLFDLDLSFVPYAGYSLISNNLLAFGQLMSLSVASFTAQLLLITIFIFIWPWLLFGGFILRSTFFTRRIGGLLIAIALAGLLVYPAVFAFEYTALGNGVPSAAGTTNSVTGLNSTYGFNAITPLPGATSTVGNSIPSNYIVNFFVEPSIKGITTYYGCWPSGTVLGVTTHGLLGSEAVDIGTLLLPLASVISSVRYITGFALGSATPSFPLPIACTPSGAISSFFALLNAYGIIGLSSYLIPIVNLIITVSSIIGLSELFGGDTSLAGLSSIL
jgi:hypothetical protein